MWMKYALLADFMRIKYVSVLYGNNKNSFVKIKPLGDISLWDFKLDEAVLSVRMKCSVELADIGISDSLFILKNPIQYTATITKYI